MNKLRWQSQLYIYIYIFFFFLGRPVIYEIKIIFNYEFQLVDYNKNHSSLTFFHRYITGLYLFQAFFSESKVLNYSFWIQPTLSSFSPTQKQSPRALNFTNGSDGCNSVALHMISQIPSVTSTPSSTFHNFQKQLHRTLSSRTLVVPSIHQINRSVSTLNAAIGKKYRFTVHMGTCLGFLSNTKSASSLVFLHQ